MKTGDVLPFKGRGLFASLPKILSWLAMGLGAVFFIAAVIGAIQNFSPVLFWDMWPGYLEFYMRTLNGDTTAWWSQHNEHRIVLSRLLFWIDLRIFDGTSWFLILANYLLAFATWITLCVISKSVLQGDKLATSRTIYAGVTLALIFSWIQKDNLTWAFQSQMFAGTLLPMLAFMLFYQANITTGKRSTLYFIGSLVAGTIASGTMMNGLAVLPIMVVLGMLLRAPKAKLGLVVTLAIAISILYLWGANRSSSFFRSLLEQPLDVLKFFLAYVGAPAHFIFQDELAAAIIAGTIIILGLLSAVFTGLRKSIDNKAVYVVLAISLYLTLSCLAVAGSRIGWGVAYAFTSRYMTTVLALWAAMMLLLLHYCSTWHRGQIFVLLLFLAITAALVPIQLVALRKDSGALAERLVAALALELGVRDESQIKKIFPWDDRGPDYPWLNRAFSIVKAPIERNMSIFGSPLIRDAAKSLGTINQHHGVECIGGADTLTAIPGETRFSRLSLWLMDPYTGRSPGAFYVMNVDRKVIGYGVSGYPQVGLTEGGETRNAGAAAYVLSDALDERVILKGRDINCEVTVRSPDSRHFSTFSLTDMNWTNGVAKNWGPALLLSFSQSIRQGIQVNKKLKFADGSVRTISKIEDKGELAIVHVDGDQLKGELVGFPKTITVLP